MPRTAAERYFSEQMRDAEYAETYRQERARSDSIDSIDAVLRALDERREQLGLSKAELARRASLRPEVVRRLLTAEQHNPTMSTIVAVANALDIDLRPVVRKRTGRVPA